MELYKALVFEMPKTNLSSWDKYYVDKIGAYVFIWSYVFNTTGALNHRDVRNKLPSEITKGEQYDLLLDIDSSDKKHLHDRYGTPKYIKDYLLMAFKTGKTNVDF